MTGILTIYSSANTVFTPRDIAMLWGETNGDLLKSKIYYYARTKKLYRIRRGFYAKNGDYDRLEFAGKLFTPSYVSFETVLAKAGVIFQVYGDIFAASYLTREVEADGQHYVYKKIKDAILTNPKGIEKSGAFAVASPERAFLDAVYLYKDYYFDNLAALNWDKVFEILPIYGGKKMEKRVKEYGEQYKMESK